MLAGMGMLVVSLLLNTFLTRFSRKYQIKQMKYKDSRVKTISEILNGMKVNQIPNIDTKWDTSINIRVYNHERLFFNILIDSHRTICRTILHSPQFQIHPFLLCWEKRKMVWAMIVSVCIFSDQAEPFLSTLESRYVRKIKKCLPVKVILSVYTTSILINIYVWNCAIRTVLRYFDIFFYVQYRSFWY